MDDLSRFLAKIDYVDGHWIWTAAKDKDGYGRFKWGGKTRRSHQFSYLYYVGEIAEGLQIDHLCRVRACARPDHLEAVTSRTNTLRGKTPAAKNFFATHCVKGHEFSEENTGIRTNGNRYCKFCSRLSAREYMRKKRGAKKIYKNTKWRRFENDTINANGN